ncbi:serine hydrolase [Pseudomonadales bacterium]|nr:serine hydrolase [Pseudomonadales bacterium]
MSPSFTARLIAKYFIIFLCSVVLVACESSQNTEDTTDTNNDTDLDTIDNLIDNCPSIANTDQTDTDSDGAGDVCDSFPNDANNDIDDDTVSGEIDNCPTVANTDQLDTDMDDIGDACDVNTGSVYHFDFFYNQLSSDTNAFKTAVVSETVTKSDGTIDIGVGVNSTTLDLGDDPTANGRFDVRASYGTSEASLSYNGTNFSSATPTSTDTTVSDDNLANTVTEANDALTFSDESPAVTLSAWGEHNYIGSGRVTLNGVSSTLANVQEQALSVLTAANGNSSDADLNADYGVVILDTVYGDESDSAEAEELVNLFSAVATFAFDGNGAVTLSEGSNYASGVGINDGAITFSTSLPANNGIYTVSPSGAIDIELDGESTFGFTDSEGDLITLGDPNSRLYGVKLGSGVSHASLANTTFDLQGLVIESSNVTLNASTYVGGVIKFSADGTTLTFSGNITKAVAAFSDSALPSVTTETETLSMSSEVITVADNGRFAPIKFTDSGLELDGFYTANGGLLLRLVDTFAQAGGIGGAGLQTNGEIFLLTDAPFNGDLPQVCNELVANSNSCAEYRDINEGEALSFLTNEGQFVTGIWTNGINGSFTELARNNENTAHDFAAINSDAGQSYDDYFITQGLIFGTPVNFIAGQIVESLFTNAPIVDAEVTLLFNDTTVQTDADGRYHFAVREALPFTENLLAASVSAEGYRPREINIGLNNESAIELKEQNAYQYFSPVQLDDGLETAALSDKNINADLINQLMQKVVQQDESLGYRQIHSLLIYKDGALVLEEYNIGNNDFIDFENNITRVTSRPDKQWGRTDKHYIASVNKALTSTVTGLALEAYDLEVDDKISTLLPEKASFFTDPNKAAVSIKHMLTMQLGFTWNEWASNDLSLLWQSNDFTEFLLNRDNAGPETEWVYNSASPNMLLRGLDNTVDGGIRDWAHNNFYSKLGITDYDWISQPDGIPEGGARMHMRPRDMLKVGITYLNNGVWDGEQVIPAQWVEDVSTVQVASFAGDYSYYFWHRTIGDVSYISADGDGGQYINIFPDQNMVIVMTQGNYGEFQLYSDQAKEIMEDYILPAVGSQP